MCNYDARGNGRMTIYRSFDFGWFDSVSKNFYLFIDATEVSDLAVLQLASQIPRSIQPRGWGCAELIENEFLSRQLRSIAIAARDAPAAGAQLTNFTARNLP